jgi:TonB family protein
MKKDKAEHPKRKNFIKLPTYPGGKDALGKYIKENLRYPEEAEKNNISGSVYVGFDVDHMGEVSGAKIIKGIGYGCDDEALRLVRLLKYNKTFNRGLRVKKTMKIRIDFKISPKITITYVKSENNPDADKENKPESKKFGYTIKY